jgi:hypothetical protein
MTARHPRAHLIALNASRPFGNTFAQIDYDDVYPPRGDQPPDSGPDLTGKVSDRNVPPAANGNHHMI